MCELHHEYVIFFFFNDPATPEIYTLSLPDALPILRQKGTTTTPFRSPTTISPACTTTPPIVIGRPICPGPCLKGELDRKSTRLNSSHANISYAVFCLKKKLETHAGASDGAQVALSA